MGVDVTFYTVFGIRTDYDSDLTDDLYEAQNDLPFVQDGMMGEYLVLGPILFKAAENDPGDYFWELKDVRELVEKEQEYKKLFREKFPDRAALMDQPFKLMSFIHYS